MLLLAVCSIGGQAFGQENAFSRNPRYMLINPYLWIPGIRGDMEIGSIELSVDTGFTEPPDGWNYSANLQLGAQQNRWGVRLEPSVTWLSAQGALDLPILGSIDAVVNLRQLMIDLAGSFRLVPQPVILDLLAGVRYVYLTAELDVVVPLLGREKIADETADWLEPIAGIYILAPLYKTILLSLKADIGGFGLQSKYSWNVLGQIGFAPSDQVALWLGYRWFGTNYSREILVKTVAGGPVLGVSASW